LEKICEGFTTVDTRQLFRKNPFEGLQIFDPDQKRWLVVLGPEIVVDGQPLPPEPIKDAVEALLHVMDQQGIYIIHNAHLVVEPMIPVFTQTTGDWLDGFHLNDADKMGPTIILASCKDEVPPELSHLITRFEMDFPTEEELRSLVDFIAEKTEIALDNQTRARIAKAGKGLTESEFITASVQSIVDEKTITPSRMSSIKIAQISSGGNLEIKVPKYKLDSVGGLDHAKEILAMNAWMHKNPDKCAELGVEPLSKMVLVGVSGSGKSLLAEAAASALDLELAVFNVSAMMSKFVGESESNMRNAFKQIHALAPVVLWTDEVGRDFSGGASSGHTDGGTTSRVHGTLLSGLQELPKNVFWVGAANSLADLPPEMLRSGRIDQLLFVGFPTKAEREEIFRIHLHNHAQYYDLEKLASYTPLFTGAEIQSLIKQVRFNIVGKYKRRPTTEDMIAQAPLLKNRVWRLHRDEILTMYRQAKAEWAWASSAQEAEADLIFQADEAERKGRTAGTTTRRVPNMSELAGAK
jgi:SpoVK/Ycf46/Vps4 family AAA+-type ATPase